jgi:hypothetical protein
LTTYKDSSAKFVIGAGTFFACDFWDSIPEHLFRYELVLAFIFAHINLRLGGEWNATYPSTLPKDGESLLLALRFLDANHLHLG